MRESRRIPGIEGLRALAAGMVLVHHVHIYSTPPGGVIGGRVGSLLGDFQLGVMLFFALSGFLLFQPFATAILTGRERPSLRRYFRNRAARILPAYWVILALCFLVLGTASPGPGHAVPSLRGILQAGTLTQNLTSATFQVGLGPAWSLAIEAVFYLVLPVLGLGALGLARRASSRRGRLIACLVPAALLLLVGWSGKYVAGHVVHGADWGRGTHSIILHSFWAQADLFAFGMVGAILFVLHRRGELRLQARWRGRWLAAIVVLAIPVLSLRWNGLEASPLNTLGALVAAMVVLFVATASPGSRLLRVLEQRAVVYAGLISYSVFLWNEQTVRFLAGHGLTASGGWGGFAVNIIICAAGIGLLASLTYRFVEAPALAAARRRSRRRVPGVQVEAAP